EVAAVWAATVVSADIPFHCGDDGDERAVALRLGLGFDWGDGVSGREPGPCGGAIATTTGAQPSCVDAFKLVAIPAITTATSAAAWRMAPGTSRGRPVSRCRRPVIIAPPDLPAGRLPT